MNCTFCTLYKARIRRKKERKKDRPRIIEWKAHTEAKCRSLAPIRCLSACLHSHSLCRRITSYSHAWFSCMLSCGSARRIRLVTYSTPYTTQYPAHYSLSLQDNKFRWQPYYSENLAHKLSLSLFTCCTYWNEAIDVVNSYATHTHTHALSMSPASLGSHFSLSQYCVDSGGGSARAELKCLYAVLVIGYVHNQSITIWLSSFSFFLYLVSSFHSFRSYVCSFVGWLGGEIAGDSLSLSSASLPDCFTGMFMNVAHIGHITHFRIHIYMGL